MSKYQHLFVCIISLLYCRIFLEFSISFISVLHYVLLDFTYIGRFLGGTNSLESVVTSTTILWFFTRIFWYSTRLHTRCDNNVIDWKINNVFRQIFFSLISFLFPCKKCWSWEYRSPCRRPNLDVHASDWTHAAHMKMTSP